MRSAIGPNVVGATASAVCDVEDMEIILDVDVDETDGRMKLAALGSRIVLPTNKKSRAKTMVIRYVVAAFEMERRVGMCEELQDQEGS